MTIMDLEASSLDVITDVDHPTVHPVEYVAEFVQAPEFAQDKKVVDQLGARAVELFHNTTLNVITPRNESIGTTSSDPQRYLGRVGAAAYDLLHEGK